MLWLIEDKGLACMCSSMPRSMSHAHLALAAAIWIPDAAAHQLSCCTLRLMSDLHRPICSSIEFMMRGRVCQPPASQQPQIMLGDIALE